MYAVAVLMLLVCIAGKTGGLSEEHWYELVEVWETASLCRCSCALHFHAAATVGSFQNIIVSWSTYTLFD